MLVQVANGTPKSSQSSDFDWGSKSSPINNLTTALEVYASGDTIIMMKGTHTGSSNRGIIVPNNNKSFVLMGDPEHLASETIIDRAIEIVIFILMAVKTHHGQSIKSHYIEEKQVEIAGKQLEGQFDWAALAVQSVQRSNL